MGNNSGRISKDEKERRKSVSEKIISQRKEEISNLQNAVLHHSSSPEDIKHTIMATECAKNQLERGGKPFNKKDLITIIIALDRKRVSDIDKLDKLRIEDLNALIRAIIYDMQLFIPISQSMLTQGNEKREVIYQLTSNSVQTKKNPLTIQNQSYSGTSSLVLFQK